MTQEQKEKSEIWIHNEDFDNEDQVFGAQVALTNILTNPTDFGLVSMETMFEFAEWMNENVFQKSTSYPYILRSDGFKPITEIENYYTTPELFQLFKQNKEK